MRSKHKRIAVCLSMLSMLILVAYGQVTFGAPRLRTIQVPKSGAYAKSDTFMVPDRGIVAVTVEVKVKTALAVVPGSRFLVELMRGNRAIERKTVSTFGPGYSKITISTSIRCYKRGRYHVRIKNITGTVKLPGEARFPRVVVPTVKPPKSYNVSRVNVASVKKGFFTFSRYLSANRYGSKVEFDLNWTRTCGKDPSGCKIVFYLKRNGVSVKRVESTQHARIKFDYVIPMLKRDGNWVLEAAGPSLKRNQDLRGTLKVTPNKRCD